MNRTKYLPHSFQENERIIIFLLTEMKKASLQGKKKKWIKLDKKLFIAQKNQLKLKKEKQW